VTETASTLTFLLTDIEGSTRHWEQSPDAMRASVARHDAIIRRAVEMHEGQVVKSMGDGFLAVFSGAIDGLRAALDAQRALDAEDWGDTGQIRVRMALHSGPAEARDHDYFGPALNRVARLLAAGHGGQLLLSSTAERYVRDDLPPEVTLRDLGERRLKDLIQPDHIYQVVDATLPAEFPPLNTLDTRPNNLPVQPTSFVGREAELRQVTSLLDTTRCLTLIGAGGIGKTRLALQAATELIDDYRDGVWFVELASLSDGQLVPRTVAAALSVPPETGRSPLDTLSDALRARQLLLILDNCEHVIESCARLVDRLLHDCPETRTLATSREALGIAGERRWTVPPLATPPGDARPSAQHLSSYESVRLFLERATMIAPGFTLTEANGPAISQISRQLDGIPLAIELAAARVNVLSPDQIAQRLDDRFRLLKTGSRTAQPRQQTLQALIDWSYDLLSVEERLLFNRLGVFAGGFTLEAAESICGFGDIDPFDVLDLLTHLVDKSLILVDSQRGEPRYRMLETLRAYARRQLEHGDDGMVVRGRHAHYFCNLAERAEPMVHSTDQGLWLDRLEAEHDNLRAALAWSREAAVEIGLRIAAALWRFWWLRGYLSEGRAQLDQLVALANSGTSPAALLKARHALGVLSFREGDYDAARVELAAAQARARELGDLARLADVLRDHGRMAIDQADFDTADSLLAEILEIERGLDDEAGVAWTLARLALLRHFQGRNDEAASLLQDGLDRFRRLENQFGRAVLLYYLGRVACDQDDFSATHRYWAESLRTSWTHRYLWPIPYHLEGFAVLAVRDGDYTRAVRLAGAASVLRQRVTAGQPPAWRDDFQRRFEPARVALDKDVYDAAWAEGQAMTLDDAVRLALKHAVDRCQPEVTGAE
jgi:predicted ATPase/class 3 adenylate cyclase